MRDSDEAVKKCRLWIKENKKTENPEEQDKENISSDVMGSYTGVADDPCEVPVQDADDL